MLFGYNLLRGVSNSPEIEQANIQAVKILVEAGCEKIYIDFVRGGRRQLYQVLSYVTTNDVLVVPKFQILGKTRASFLTNVEILRQKGVYIRSLEEKLLLSGFELIEYSNLATTLFPDEEHLSALRAYYQGKKNKKNGRPPLLREQKELIRLLRLIRINQKEICKTRICELAGVSRQSYYNLFPVQKKSA